MCGKKAKISLLTSKRPPQVRADSFILLMSSIAAILAPAIGQVFLYKFRITDLIGTCTEIKEWFETRNVDSNERTVNKAGRKMNAFQNIMGRRLVHNQQPR